MDGKNEFDYKHPPSGLFYKVFIINNLVFQMCLHENANFSVFRRSPQ